MLNLSLEKEWGLERGLVRTIFEPCANVLAGYLREVSPLQRVLDVGCGSGIAGRTVATRYATVKHVGGFDYEPAAVHVAAAQTKEDPRFEFWEGNAEQFEVKELYDAVIAQHLLHQLTKPEDAVRRMRAALRFGGRMIIAQWPELEKCPAYAFIYKASGEYDKKAKERVMTKARLEKVVLSAGGLKLIVSELRTDFEATAIVPKEFLSQYFQGSQFWLQQDDKIRNDKLESPMVDQLGLSYGRRAAGGVKFGLGMLVVVAEPV